MIELKPQTVETPFDNPTARTIGFELKGSRLRRTIEQLPIWNTQYKPRMAPVEKIIISQAIQFDFQQTADRMRAFNQEMRELARMVQLGKASWSPVVCFTDGRRLWACSSFETIMAARSISPPPGVPVICYEGTEADAIQFAINHSDNITAKKAA
ncbi:uncharacterized protein Dvar_56420 [Desulfosarcina variabilis str. Montpellier]|uniref:hypothetical protein n=1 Tax=Desulfosarcina variabilis TaxID=2300 RepID=UPI003AFB6AEA